MIRVLNRRAAIVDHYCKNFYHKILQTCSDKFLGIQENIVTRRRIPVLLRLIWRDGVTLKLLVSLTASSRDKQGRNSGCYFPSEWVEELSISWQFSHFSIRLGWLVREGYYQPSDAVAPLYIDYLSWPPTLRSALRSTRPVASWYATITTQKMLL